MTKQPRLRERVEHNVSEHAPAADTLDAEIGTYVDAFLKDLPKAVELEKFNLLTKEEAQRAVGILDQTLHRLKQQLHNAQALQKLLQQRR